jgi:hypothetical protein
VVAAIHWETGKLMHPLIRKKNANEWGTARVRFWDDAGYAHSVRISGGRSRVCMTTQYCSVFSRSRLSCSVLA